MNAATVIESLGLPAQAMLTHRVPKTLLIEHGAPTAADKRHIESGIEELRWIATLKPTTVGVASFSDDTREVVELEVLALRVRATTKGARLVELVHRAVPYHLLLLTDLDAGNIQLSLADKRWAQNERGRVVIDGDLVVCDLGALSVPVRDRLLGSLSLANQPRTNLYALYRGWMDAVRAAKVAVITGEFVLATDARHAERRAEAMDACAVLESRIASLRSAAAKERQLARQVEINMQLKSLRAELDEARGRL